MQRQFIRALGIVLFSYIVIVYTGPELIFILLIANFQTFICEDIRVIEMMANVGSILALVITFVVVLLFIFILGYFCKHSYYDFWFCGPFK